MLPSAVDIISHLLVESSARASIYDNVNFGEEERAVLLRVPGPDNILSAGYYQFRRTGVIPRIPPFEPKDIRLIFHTSAIPKPSTQLQEVDSWIKSLYHVGLTTLLAGRIFHGTFERRCFPSCIQDARACPAFLNQMRNLDGIITGGVHLPQDEELWAWKNGIPPHKRLWLYGIWYSYAQGWIPRRRGGGHASTASHAHSAE
uniref:Uncharacterized protein n=1 Tax=Moniliophthora roreri TaxID=221103 RepID=A0A0W0F870_MONRR